MHTTKLRIYYIIQLELSKLLNKHGKNKMNNMVNSFKMKTHENIQKV